MLFPTHRLLDKSNVLRFRRRLRRLQRAYAARRIAAPQIRARLISWMGHASHAKSSRLVRRLLQEYRFVRPGERQTTGETCGRNVRGRETREQLGCSELRQPAGRNQAMATWPVS